MSKFSLFSEENSFLSFNNFVMLNIAFVGVLSSCETVCNSTDLYLFSIFSFSNNMTLETSFIYNMTHF